MVPLVVSGTIGLPMVPLAYHGTNCTIWRANGTIGITIGTNGITIGTIGKTLNDIGIPLVPLGNPVECVEDLSQSPKLYNFFMLNSAGYEIQTVHKYQNSHNIKGIFLHKSL